MVDDPPPTPYVDFDAIERSASVCSSLRLSSAFLVMLFFLAAVVATIVIGWETHFDCGGTFGGYGSSATSGLDEACVNGRRWRYAAAVGVMAGTTALAGLAVHRFVAKHPGHRIVGLLAVTIPLMAFWALGVTVMVLI